MVKPLSAITDIPGLSSRWVNSLDTRVNSTSDMDSTYKGEMKDMQPLGVNPIKS